MGILEKIRKLCFKFLWSGNKEYFGLPWTSWKTLACPKSLGGWGLKSPIIFAKSLAAKSVWNVINGLGLWAHIVLQKYVHPMSLLDWIRSSVKHKRSMSICWKAVPWSFDIISNNLVWKIGSGAVVRLGLDPWVGCKWRHHLPPLVIEKLHSYGFFSLKDIGTPRLTCPLEQSWLSTEQLGLVDQHDVIVWKGYLAILKSSHVRLSNDSDVLVWSLSKSRKYSPKEGYAQLLLDRNMMEYSWWWKVLWKFKCPLKEKSFC